MVIIEFDISIRQNTYSFTESIAVACWGDNTLVVVSIIFSEVGIVICCSTISKTVPSSFTWLMSP